MWRVLCIDIVLVFIIDQISLDSPRSSMTEVKSYAE